MKLLKKISLIVAGLFILFLSSCSDDFPEREESFVPDTNAIKVYFPASNKSTFEVDPSDVSVQVKVARMNSSSAATVAIAAKDYDNVFTVPATVEFAAGESEKNITVGFSGLEVFTEYKLELILEEKHTNPYIEMSNGTTNFLLIVSQTDWSTYATGTYQSGFTNTQWTQILQYSEILGRYRFPNLYAAGYHYQFIWDGGRALTPIGTLDANGLYVQQSGYVHPQYGMVSTRTDSDPAWTYYSAASDAFVFDRIYFVSAGSFGWKTDYFFITSRP